MEPRSQPKPPASWNPSASSAIGAEPPQRYTVAEFPSVEKAIKDTTGVTLPFVDLTRGPGALANNASVIASSPLLKGLVGREYAENEMVPAGLSPTAQDEASRLLSAEPGFGGHESAMLAWANEPQRDAGSQVRTMKDLLTARSGR